MNLETRIRSTVARLFSTRGFQELSRNGARLKRRLSGGQPEIHYFHQVDDPYSHLAVQKLDQLRATYPLAFKVHLCSQPGADYLGSSYVAIVEWIGYDIGSYGNIMRWMSVMKSRPSWDMTHAEWNARAAGLRAQMLQPVAAVK